MKERLVSVALNQIHIDDPFWNKYTRLVTREIIPYQWKVLNDQQPDAEPSHCMENYRIAAGEAEGEFHGFVFQDTDLAKWLEAVAYSLSYEPNPELEALADEAIALVGRAQEADGYLNTHFTISAPESKFRNLCFGHELYTAGHMMEAAVAYYQVTGKRALLDIMCRNADLICKVFHTEEFAAAYPGHEEVEIGLIRLYYATGKRDYLEMAKDFVERRGVDPDYFFREMRHPKFIRLFNELELDPPYGQYHLPVRKQKTAEGHAVRAVYLYSAMADLAWEYQDESMLEACKVLYDNMTNKRMYITGGIGSSGAYERFTTDYDLPNGSNYSESCASIGLAFFCRRMLQITREGKYGDTMERALMNTVLSGIAMTGKAFFYVNPLEVWPDNCMDHTSMAHVKPVRQKWFGCACCPPNIARTLASLGEYAIQTAEKELWVELFLSGKAEITLDGVAAAVTMETKFPFSGDVTLRIQTERPVSGRLAFRLPGYAKAPAITVNGEAASVKEEKGHLILEGTWDDQTIRYTFEIPPRFVYANPKVRADAGKVAVMKGPLVYCLEQEDNGENLAGLLVDTAAGLTEEYRAELLGGTVVIHAKGKGLAKEQQEEA
ncbi:MAG: glycoside hydrolase family 127 protein, partial [Oscillospiraceae bacterium]|nr:glycoside hydrolase family 127 protein [Oscillospiraceae bacterium]